jgi:hypothetical protein
MRFFETEATIQASPDRVWKILTDVGRYSDWESGVVRVEGKAALGEKVTLVSEANPGRAFPLKVTELVPGRKMVFSGGMPLGLFKGVRTYSLAPEGDQATRFKMREEYTGPMLPMIWGSIPDLNPSFQKFATGLKKEAETKSS